MSRDSSTSPPEIRVSIEVSDIYQHSPVRLIARGQQEFSLQLRSAHEHSRAQLVSVAAGWTTAAESTTIAAESHNGGWLIDAHVTGLISESPSSPLARAERHAPTTLGVRWFPFVSSTLGATLSVAGASLQSMAVSCRRDSVRLRRSDPVWNDAVASPRKALSFEGYAWTVVVEWERPLTNDIDIDVPLQTSAAEVSRLISGAGLASLFSFVTTAVAAEIASAYVAFGAFAAFVAFLLTQWRSNPRTHHLTAFGVVYIMLTMLSLVWVISWTTIGFWAMCLVPLVGLGLREVFLTVPVFEAVGHPPQRFSAAVGQLMIVLEKMRQRRRDNSRLSEIRSLLTSASARLHADPENESYVLKSDGQSLLRLRRLNDEFGDKAALDTFERERGRTGSMVIDDLGALFTEFERLGVEFEPQVADQPLFKR